MPLRCIICCVSALLKQQRLGKYLSNVSPLLRFTGTDTDAFAYSNGGVASALISLPLRYMHTTVEMVQKEDVENVIRLIYETLLTIKPEDSFSYFD